MKFPVSYLERPISTYANAFDLLERTKLFVGNMIPAFVSYRERFHFIFQRLIAFARSGRLAGRIWFADKTRLDIGAFSLVLSATHLKFAAQIRIGRCP